jgi:hypothetical protein
MEKEEAKGRKNDGKDENENKKINKI